MKENLIRYAGCFVFNLWAIILQAQEPIYNATPTKIVDLVHTKLELDFDWMKKMAFGKAWVTLKPHAYPIESVNLDAKGMEIHKVSIIDKTDSIASKNYKYDTKVLSIPLVSVLAPNESLTIYVEYTAKPEETDEKGLHFINTDKSNDELPAQIWTMGQPERNSVWFPTIDRPNQKTTLEISLKVPKEFSTLVNGSLISNKEIDDSSRLDTWKQTQPHAPYLTFFAIGDFTILKDSWNGKEISYFIEPKFAKEPKIEQTLFPNTVEAIEYFSTLLDIEYPWDKYSQIRLQHFPGGMENTTASAFGAGGSLIKIADEEYLAGHIHELFHQWFGNYVTCESWANTALNESFADLSEILWAEYKFGKDVADRRLQKGLKSYLSDSTGFKIPLIRYDYADPNHMFNGITYQKGGRILNMLRHYLGNDVFVLGMRDYLKQNAFGTAEAEDLRLSMEKVSGKDLHWFFDQWFYGFGHPVLDIRYNWNETKSETTVIVNQKQQGNLFSIPVDIDIYEQDKKTRHQVWLSSKFDTLTFNTNQKPLLINFDATKALIAQKTDNKSLEEFAFQFYNAPLYSDRNEAIQAMAEYKGNEIARKVLFSALKDKFYAIRLEAIDILNNYDFKANHDYFKQLETIAKNDPNNLVKALAISSLGYLEQKKHYGIFQKSLKTKSFAVQKASFEALFKSNPIRALKDIRNFENNPITELQKILLKKYSEYGSDYEWNYLHNLFQSSTPPKQYKMINEYGLIVSRQTNIQEIEQGIAGIQELGIIGKVYGVDDEIIKVLEMIKQKSKLVNIEQIVDKAMQKIKSS